MKLNKKYCALIDSDSGYDNQLLADCCENVADEFAIGFAEWCAENHYTLLDINSYSGVHLWNNEHRQETTKKLLKIYKKEKGL